MMKTILRKLIAFCIALMCTGAVRAGDFVSVLAFSDNDVSRYVGYSG